MMKSNVTLSFCAVTGSAIASVTVDELADCYFNEDLKNASSAAIKKSIEKRWQENSIDYAKRVLRLLDLGQSVDDINETFAMIDESLGEDITLPIRRCNSMLLAEAPDEPTNGGQPKSSKVTDVDSHSWIVKSQISPIDDTTNVYPTLWSTNEIQGRFGHPGNAAMVIRCKENTSTVYFKMNDLFLSDIQSYGNVITRLDQDKARTYRMKESTNHEALGLWRGGTAIHFIKRLFDHDKLLVQITPYNESPVMATFNIQNLRTAIEPMRKACNW